jgi:hypothetical protein
MSKEADNNPITSITSKKFQHLSKAEYKAITDKIAHYAEIGLGCAEIARLIEQPIKRVIWIYYNSEVVKTSVEAYLQNKSTISSHIQKTVDENIIRILDHISDLDLRKVLNKDISGILKQLTTIRDVFSKHERLDKGESTDNVQHFWSQVSGSDDPTLKVLDAKVIDISSSLSYSHKPTESKDTE